jgi:hypothetical protein
MHPAIVVHMVANAALRPLGRFTIGVGTGEALNESLLSDRWPPRAASE